MPSDPVNLARLKALAALSDDDLGHSEEDLKMRFAVPLLEALGHTRLRFEHKGKDILVRDGLPRGSSVVVETKRPDLGLDAHLAQLERYAAEERALLAVLTNGRHIRVYSPFWNRARSFAESLLWDFARADLDNARHVNDLSNVLSHGALAGGWAISALMARQASIEGIWRTAEGIRGQHRERRAQLQQRLREIERQAAQLESDRRAAESELGELPARERDKLRALFRLICVPLVPAGEFGYAIPAEPTPEPTVSPTSRPKVPRKRKPRTFREWTDDDLRKKVTPYQARIFEAFVLAGKPTLGLKQIAEAVGLMPNAVAAATAPFRYRKEYSGRDPVLIHQRVSRADRLRTGDLFTIVPRHWPTIQRLYAPAAPRRRAKKPSTD